jgi:hypothetical protein
MAKTKKKQFNKAKKNLVIKKRVILAVVLIAALGSLLWVRHAHSQPKNSQPVSYQVMQLAQSIVKETKPAPTTAALEYAYVASTYSDSLQAADQAQALYATCKIMKMIWPDKQQLLTDKIKGVAQDSRLKFLTDDRQLSATVKNVVQIYQSRYANDGHDLAWDGIIPAGAGKWRKIMPVDPFTPRAGDWQRWVVNSAISVPPPPVYGSLEDLKQINIVRQASAARNGEDVNQINFWGGAPGTETPSGIWQNQLYRTIGPELPKDYKKADVLYSGMQKALSQVLSDAFMECWKVKYTYWTARPDMRVSDIHTAMKDPLFPSYISGHSTVSKAAADVLSVLAPKHATEWENMAMEARRSRLVAGIHFEIDNQVGFDVGTAVASQHIQNLGLKQIL